MPEISLFYGIRITMYYDDHNPPHFHAEYNGNKAIIDKNEDILKKLYDTNIKFGLWAYEHEIKKMQYLEN